ncbi:MAG: TraB/GumN family protein, partial [Methylococcaceae bacterium]|nr:TraB/GumN family protein [Methylococcaceae bacterium]
TYALLKHYLKSRKIPVARLKQFKPPMAMMSLMMLELKRLGMAEIGVDMFFNQKALAENKKRLHLESIEKQLTILENMGKGHADDLVLSTLKDLKKLAAEMDELKNAWRSGDLQQLEEIGIKPFRSEHPSLYQLMLVERNNSWIPMIESLLTTVEKELVLVGFLHLAGQEGLLAQLQTHGYQVTLF